MLPCKDCFVCGTATATLALDTATCNLDFVVNKVLKGKLGFHQPNVSCGDTELICYAEDTEDGVLAKKLERQLTTLVWSSGEQHTGVKDGDSLVVDDDLTSTTLRIVIQHQEFDEEDVPDLFMVSNASDSGGECSAPVCSCMVRTALMELREFFSGGEKRSREEGDELPGAKR